MPKITHEEYRAIPRKSEGKYSPIQRGITALAVDEHYLIEKNDWQKKNPPFQYVLRVGKRYKMKFVTETIVAGSGWIVTRIS